MSLSLLFGWLTLVVSACFSVKSPQAGPVRGTWITNVGSHVLDSKDSIDAAVRLCREKGINNIYVAVWDDGMTLYPSRVTQKYIGIGQQPSYRGRDPLAEIIESAHAAGIRVHAWLEFGFSYAYRDSNSPWVRRYPDWAGRRRDGSLLEKNGFYWWNGLNPAVQEFMDSLVTEIITRYQVDGIQGDDRLPAMPAEGGYDNFTREKYRQEHAGQNPPDNPKDSAFLQWKADGLSRYAKNLYTLVKSIRPDCIVSWSPSVYPWCKEEYLQDWPKWMSGGYADYVIPQVYRYNIKAYESTLKSLLPYIPAGMRDRVFPGILTSLANGYEASPDFTREMIETNSKYGFGGEVFFYFETLHRIDYPLLPN